MARKAQPIRTRFVSETVEFRPIAAINTTPLIDMMLVILIMVIVAIPMRNPKVAIDLPAARTQSAPPPSHVLAIDRAGALAWDGQALPAELLPARLAALASDPDRPVLQLAPDGEGRYARFDEILAQIRRAGITRLGFVGNQRFAETFGR